MLSSQLFWRVLAVYATLTFAVVLVFARDPQFWGAAVLLGLMGVAITYLVVGRMIGPLETLTRAAREMAEGRMPAEIPVRSRNEIGTLAEAFNSMSRQLSSRIRDLEDQRRHAAESHA